MVRRLFVGVGVALALAAGIATEGTALAHFGGTPGKPNCHGQAISHAANDHDLPPGQAFRDLFEPDLHDAGDLHDIVRSACVP